MASLFRTIVAAAIANCILLSCVASAQQAKELTDEEFYEIRHNKERCLLVLAHASWAHQSKHAKVVADNLAAYMPKSDYPEVEVAMIDVHKYRKLGRVEGVIHPPSFLFYTFGGEPAHYSFHDDENVVKHMMEHVAEKLDGDKEHRMLAQEREATEAKWNIPHPGAGTVVDLQSEDEFYQYTHDITRTVMVMFYAPWCQACKAYTPEYEELAKYFVDDHKVMIAKVDGEKFSGLADKYKVDGYPTLMLFLKNREGKTGKIYNGDRDVAHLTQYLNQLHQMAVDLSEGKGHEMFDEIEDLVRREKSDGEGDEHPFQHGERGGSLRHDMNNMPDDLPGGL